MKKIKYMLSVVCTLLLLQITFVEFYREKFQAAGATGNSAIIRTSDVGEVSGRKMTITVIDVGHGDAALLQHEGKNLLLDTGSGKYRAALSKKLAGLGVQKIDTMILTHHHSDHIGNAVYAAGKYNIRAIYDNGLINENSSVSLKLGSMLTGGYKNRKLKAGDVISLGSGAKLEVLSPGDFLAPELRRDLNNNSVVLQLRYDEFSMLFCADIEAPAEAALAEKYGSLLKSDVLRVAHHGSRTSSYFKFIEQVSPRYALVSCGPYEEYRHPNEKVVSRLEYLGAKVMTTAKHGDLTITTDGKNYLVQGEK